MPDGARTRDDGDVVLFDYWRSSASYRVRIALNLLGLRYRTETVDLLAREHTSPAHLARNPQGFVPALFIDGVMMTQSLAIIEYLDETHGGSLLPGDAASRQRVRALSHAIAMDIHPVCNLSVAAKVVELAGGGDETRAAWMRHFIGRGLAALETMLEDRRTGSFCHGDAPTMADICLVPQVYNARRWGAPLDRMPRVVRIAEACAAVEAFATAHPELVRAAGP